MIADPQVAPSTSLNMGAGQDKSDVQTKYNTNDPLSDSVIAAEDILQRQEILRNEETAKKQNKLEIVFTKHYVPNH